MAVVFTWVSWAHLSSSASQNQRGHRLTGAAYVHVVLGWRWGLFSLFLFVWVDRTPSVMEIPGDSSLRSSQDASSWSAAPLTRASAKPHLPPAESAQVGVLTDAAAAAALFFPASVASVTQ